MKKHALLVALALTLLAAPATAQSGFPSGVDVWNTAPGTSLGLGAADWKALCGKDGPDMDIPLTGGSLPGLQAADTVVRRLDPIVFDSTGVAQVRIQTRALSLISESYEETPCGYLAFSVALDPNVQQRVSTMRVTRTSSKGGSFQADVLIDGIVKAHSTSGAVVGSLPFSATVVDSNGSTPWSTIPPQGSNLPSGAFYAGVDSASARALLINRWHWLRNLHWYFFAAIDHQPAQALY